MKLHHHPETDGFYTELKAGLGTETRDVDADFAADGTIVGLDIEGASKPNLRTLQAHGVPLAMLKAEE